MRHAGAAAGRMIRDDPILESLTRPGAPFEISRVGDMPRFAAAPADLNAMIETARAHGAATFIVEGDARLSFDDVFRLRDALAAVLPVSAGERVAIAMRNRAQWIIAFLAVVRLGATPVLVNSRAAGPDMAAAIADTEVALVLADAERAGALRQGGHQGPMLETDAFPTEGELARPAPTPDPDAPAAILFTSGTTGRVKGAVLTHRNLVTGLMCVQLSGAMVLHNLVQRHGVAPEILAAHRPQAASLLVFPLFHISGLGAGFLSPMLSGAKIVIMRRWDPAEAQALIPQEKITAFTAVPTMLWDMLHRAKAGAADLSGLTSVSSGGQGLPLNLLEEVRQAAPTAMVGSGFGLTETAGAVAMAVGEDFTRRPASSGRVLPLVEVRVLDESGAVLPDGATGEIAVRGPMVMAGYWNRPVETAEVLSPDGWFRTGDIGYVDADGYIFIVDRAKDMVISGGENIYCAEVERAITQLPQVAEVAAFGLPDERLGEALVAVVVGDGLTESGVRQHVAAELAAYKAPARVAFSGEPLPRNATGKIDKIALRRAFAHLNGAAST